MTPAAHPALLPTRAGLPAATGGGAGLRGLITEADLPAAEREWPGLQAYLAKLPAGDRPPTFLQLVWRFEAWRATAAH